MLASTNRSFNDSRREQVWGMIALIAVSNASILSIIGRNEPLPNSLSIAVLCFAASLPMLSIRLWSLTFHGQRRFFGRGLTLAGLFGVITSFIGVLTLIWALFAPAGFVFLISSFFALVLGTRLNIRAENESREEV